ELPLHPAVLAPSSSQQTALAAQAAAPRRPPISVCLWQNCETLPAQTSIRRIDSPACKDYISPFVDICAAGVSRGFFVPCCPSLPRSEERRVGKEWRSRGWEEH